MVFVALSGYVYFQVLLNYGLEESRDVRATDPYTSTYVVLAASTHLILRTLLV